MLEHRKYSYGFKTTILHIDRRNEFKRKLIEKEVGKKKNLSKNSVSDHQRF